jgi:signal transduction histidine kinase
VKGFFRLDESRSRAGGGAGLGLGIARQLVALHGGTVGVEDATTGGAALVVKLPAGNTR